MAVKFEISFPIANQLKNTLESSAGNERMPFDQQRYNEKRSAANYIHYDYLQKFENKDKIRQQFLTNYAKSRIRISDCEGQIYNMFTGMVEPGAFVTPSLLRQYRSLKYRVDARFASVDGHLFLYFEGGYDYLDEDFLIPNNEVEYNGVFPSINAQVDDVVRYKMEGDVFRQAVIVSRAWHTDLGVAGYKLSVQQSLLNPQDGLAEITYNKKDSDLYQQLIDLSLLPEGIYFILTDFGNGTFDHTFISEPVYVKEVHEDTQALHYRHNGTYDFEDKWGCVYENGWLGVLRFPADFYKYIMSADLEADQDDTGRQRILRAVPYRQLEFTAFEIPGWLADKLAVIFSHDTKFINGYQWEIENMGDYAAMGTRDIGSLTVQLRQINDRTIFSTKFEENLTAEFIPDSFADILYEGDSIVALFKTNFGFSFLLAGLPPWITADKEVLVDGDTIAFTIAPNSGPAREATLTAVVEGVSLSAEIYFQQAMDESIPDYLEVSKTLIVLPSSAGSFEDIDIQASGPWGISESGSFSFDVSEVDGDTIRIASPSLNDTSTVRTATVRIFLIGNPLVFKDISVQQATNKKMFNAFPNIVIHGPANTEQNQTYVVEILCAENTQWQAGGPNSGDSGTLNDYLVYHKAIQFGPTNVFQVTVMAKPPYVPNRFSVITFQNINDPSDSVMITISQTT